MKDNGDSIFRYPAGRAVGASAKIWYCCARGLAASAGSTNCSELLPSNARGRIITRMKRLGRSAACAKTGSGPLSHQAPPGPYEGGRPRVAARRNNHADEAARAIGGLREPGLGPPLVPGAAGAVRGRAARRVDADAAFEQAADARPLVGVPGGAGAGRKRDVVAAQEQFARGQGVERYAKFFA